MHWVCSIRWSSTTGGTNCKCGCPGRPGRERASSGTMMTINRPGIGVAAAVVVAAAGIWYYLQSRHSAPPPPPVAAQPPAPLEPAEPPIQHPLPEGPADSEPKAPLPALRSEERRVGKE